MKNPLTKTGLAILTLSLVACGGDGSPAESPVSDSSGAPPYSLLGETFAYKQNKLEPEIHNNAKDENVIHDLDAVYFNNVKIPLPVKGAFYINSNRPHVVDNAAYNVFIANSRNDMPYSRYAYLSDITNHRRIFSFTGDGTRDMPKQGIANYKGDAIHTFFDGVGREYIYRADAKANIDFSKPNKDAILTVTISPKPGQHFKTFDFGARVEDHLFNGENVLGNGENVPGSLSADKSEKSLSKPRAIITSQGQFNGPNASELVGHYKIDRNSEYPNGAEGVFGLKKEK